MPNVRKFNFEKGQLACTPRTLPLFFSFPSFLPPILSLSRSRASSLSLSPAPHSYPAAPVTLLLRRPPVSRRRPHKLYPLATCIYILVSIYSKLYFLVFFFIFFFLYLIYDDFGGDFPGTHNARRSC